MSRFQELYERSVKLEVPGGQQQGIAADAGDNAFKKKFQWFQR
jgi:hypothetical protein